MQYPGVESQGMQSQSMATTLQYVSVGRRFVAVLVDGIVLGVVIGLLTRVLGSAVTNPDTGAVSFSVTGLPAIIIALLPFLYYIVLEALMGATLGKLVLGIRVTRLDGSRIGWGASIIRNLLRIIDALPFAYILGAILVWTSPQRQRLGDRAAHTVVIRRR